MKVARTRVRNIDLYIHPTLADQFVRVISRFDDADSARLERYGLKEPLGEGEIFLPPPVGSATKFNSEGKWLIRRDQPKEKRYVRTIYWRWKQWDGEEQEDSRDIFRLCYPRELMPPPGDEIFGFPINGEVVAATEAVNLPQAKARLLNQLNVMLEVFGSAEIVRADGTSASPAKTHRRWVFLPSGPYKKGDVSRVLTEVFSRVSDDDRLILSERQDFLVDQKPQEIAQGLGGFNDYLAYVFPEHGRVVLESLRRDNAIYIFKDSWEKFSRLSKREILDANVHDARILHTKGWQARLMTALKAK